MKLVPAIRQSAFALALFSGAANAQSGDAESAIIAFTENCFSPRMTAARAADVFDLPGVAHDFYDLDPLIAPAPSPATGDVTPGTDRRCEVSFAGDLAGPAAAATVQRLDREGIRSPAAIPAQFTETPGTALLAARRLNPRKIAVVHVGTRPGTSGIETFMNVERLVSPQEQ